ncbi:MAG: amidase [Rhodospirillaceae bacterium]|jgi:Asp-tRNA(Asn)/Glu-tRNA(Gln) amidotransferase A subunit family amidase|nr:amidase [Rhodospirillaceae bacterium]
MAGAENLTASEAAKRIREGSLTSEALVTDCLLRIEAREPEVLAWQYLDPEQALAEARARDKAAAGGLLHGVPVGVKDIIDTADRPTGYGSRLYDEVRPPWDAACVTAMRRAGAVIMGKTVTSEFAGFHQGKSRNPHDTKRQTGFSSMGSAAAVADFHVPVAFGSQTGGSIIKPASHCGCVGYKPSYGTFSLRGINPLAQATDTLGHFARTMDDVILFSQAMLGNPDFAAGGALRPNKVGLCRTAEWDTASDSVKAAVEDAAARLGKAGISVIEFAFPAEFEKLNDALLDVLAYEAAANFAYEYEFRRDGLSDDMASLVEKGRGTSLETYHAALDLAERCRRMMPDLLSETEILLTPSAEFEAPLLEEPMGRSQFIRFWSLLHVPVLNLVGPVGSLGMPVGLQFAGGFRGDQDFLRRTAWIEAALAE